MNRAFLLAAAGLIATGCYSSPTSYPATYDEVITWSFLRYKLDGTTVTYDANVYPGGTSSGSCAESGVDTVDVTNLDGSVLDPGLQDIPCVYQGVQGVLTPNIFAPGSYSVLVTGKRGSVPLYQGQLDFTIVAGGSNSSTISVPGVVDSLEIFAKFRDDSTGTVQTYASCAAARVDTLTYWVYDHMGTLVASSTATTQPTGHPCLDPAGVAFDLPNGLDRDVYTIRMQAFDAGTRIFDSCGTTTTTTFSHFGSNIGDPEQGGAGWSVDLWTPIASGC